MEEGKVISSCIILRDGPANLEILIDSSPHTFVLYGGSPRIEVGEHIRIKKGSGFGVEKNTGMGDWIYRYSVNKMEVIRDNKIVFSIKDSGYREVGGGGAPGWGGHD